MTVTEIPPRRDDRASTQRLTFVTQLRMTEVQRRYVLVVAERHDTTISGALRFLIDQALDAEPRSGGDVESSLRTLLTVADEVVPDPGWEQRHGAGGS